MVLQNNQFEGRIQLTLAVSNIGAAIGTGTTALVILTDPTQVNLSAIDYVAFYLPARLHRLYFSIRLVNVNPADQSIQVNSRLMSATGNSATFNAISNAVGTITVPANSPIGSIFSLAQPVNLNGINISPNQRLLLVLYASGAPSGTEVSLSATVTIAYRV